MATVPHVIVAVAATKGGVGKSTVAVLLAHEAHARGGRVELVDLDPQGTASAWYGPAARRLPTPTVEQLAGLGGDGLVVLDLPPGEAPNVLVGIEAADRVIGVTGPSWGELAGLVHLERIVDPDLVVLTRYDGRRTLHREGLDRLRGRYGSKVAGVVPLRAEVEAAQAAARPVARGGDVGQAVAEVLDRLIKEG